MNSGKKGRSHRLLWKTSKVVLVTLLLVGAFAPGAMAHVTTEFDHLWNQHIKPMLATPGTINTPENPVDWTKLKGVPAGLADGLDNGVDKAGFGLKKGIVIGGGTEFSVDATKVQRRVSGTCAGGQTIGAIAIDGTVTCRGPSAYIWAIPDTGTICNDWCSEGAMDVPAGTYAVTAKIQVTQAYEASNNENVRADCRLDAGGTTIDSSFSFVGDSTFAPSVVVPLQGVAALTAPGALAVVCRDAGVGDSHGYNLSIMAIKLA